MKDYTGYLLCSDYDGTLSCGDIPERNLKAIEEFMAGGGLFSLSTGRRGEELYGTDWLPMTPNAPMVGLTGAQIFDLQKGVELERRMIEDGWQLLVDELIGRIDYRQTVELVLTDRAVHFASDDRDAWRGLRAETQGESLYKLVFFHEPNGQPDIPITVKEICGKRFGLTSNGPCCFEITACGVDKGLGVRRIKELTGAKTLICAGDYLGDIAMLQAADIAVAVGNALEEVKAAADLVTVHAKDGAIAQIIKEL